MIKVEIFGVLSAWSSCLAGGVGSILVQSHPYHCLITKNILKIIPHYFGGCRK